MNLKLTTVESAYWDQRLIGLTRLFGPKRSRPYKVRLDLTVFAKYGTLQDFSVASVGMA